MAQVVKPSREFVILESGRYDDAFGETPFPVSRDLKGQPLFAPPFDDDDTAEDVELDHGHGTGSVSSCRELGAISFVERRA